MATYARRAGLVAVSGTIYVGAVYLGLQLYGNKGEDEKQSTINKAGHHQPQSRHMYLIREEQLHFRELPIHMMMKLAKMSL